MSTTATLERDSREHTHSCLGQYRARHSGLVREIITLSRPDGSTFVVDRLARTTKDARVVAHLAAGEPTENASIIAEMYLADNRRGQCARLSSEDLAQTRATSRCASNATRVLKRPSLLDAQGNQYRLRELVVGSIPELRWTRSPLKESEDAAEPIALRDLIGHLQDYEPARKLTREALAAYRHDPTCSTITLRSELERLEASATVLNRRLREVLHAAVKNRGMTMSEIALRCGRVKSNRAGGISGEASWLARRIGQSPEGGEQHPSPWIHTDVLALIAREGLNISPHEVEL